MAPPNGALWYNAPCSHVYRSFLPTQHYNGALPRQAIEVRYTMPAGELKFINCGHPNPCDCWPISPSLDFWPGPPLVIASDGGMRYHGTPAAVSSIGVFVAHGSKYNVSELMPPSEYYPTSMRAEITAAIRALNVVMHMRYDGVLRARTTVVLKMDCLDVHSVMTTRIFDWKTSFYGEGRAVPIIDRDLYFDLEDSVCNLYNHYGVKTLFWWVPRKFNEDADRLASAPLKQEEFKRTIAHAAQQAKRHEKRGRIDDQDDGGMPAKRTRVFRPRAAKATVKERLGNNTAEADRLVINMSVGGSSSARPAQHERTKKYGNTSANIEPHTSSLFAKSLTWPSHTFGPPALTNSISAKTPGSSAQNPILVPSSPPRKYAHLMSNPGSGSERAVPSKSASGTGRSLPASVASCGDLDSLNDAQRPSHLLGKPDNAAAGAVSTKVPDMVPQPVLLPQDQIFRTNEFPAPNPDGHAGTPPIMPLADKAVKLASTLGTTISSFCLARHGAPMTLSSMPDFPAMKSTIKRVIPGWAQSRTAESLHELRGIGEAGVTGVAETSSLTKLAKISSGDVAPDGAKDKSLKGLLGPTGIFTFSLGQSIWGQSAKGVSGPPKITNTSIWAMRG